jgi:hypothetical protein
MATVTSSSVFMPTSIWTTFLLFQSASSNHATLPPLESEKVALFTTGNGALGCIGAIGGGMFLM